MSNKRITKDELFQIADIYKQNMNCVFYETLKKDMERVIAEKTNMVLQMNINGDKEGAQNMANIICGIREVLNRPPFIVNRARSFAETLEGYVSDAKQRIFSAFTPREKQK